MYPYVAIIFSPDISWPTFGSRPSRASSYEHVAWAPKVWGGQWKNLQRYSINHLKIGKCSVAICAFHPRRNLCFCNHQLQILQSKVFLRSLDLIFEKKSIQLRYEIPNTEVNPNVRKFSDNHHIKCLTWWNKAQNLSFLGLPRCQARQPMRTLKGLPPEIVSHFLVRPIDIGTYKSSRSDGSVRRFRHLLVYMYIISHHVPPLWEWSDSFMSFWKCLKKLRFFPQGPELPVFK